MSSDLEKLREELAALEKELESSHFSGLFDSRAQDHKLRKLKKLRKQIAALEGEGGPPAKPAAATSRASAKSAEKKPAPRAAKKPAKTATKKRAR